MSSVLLRQVLERGEKIDVLVDKADTLNVRPGQPCSTVRRRICQARCMCGRRRRRVLEGNRVSPIRAPVGCSMPSCIPGSCNPSVSASPRARTRRATDAFDGAGGVAGVAAQTDAFRFRQKATTLRYTLWFKNLQFMVRPLPRPCRHA